MGGGLTTFTRCRFAPNIFASGFAYSSVFNDSGEKSTGTRIRRNIVALMFQSDSKDLKQTCQSLQAVDHRQCRRRNDDN